MPMAGGYSPPAMIKKNMKKILFILCTLSACLVPQWEIQAQATTLVKPRVYTLINQLLAPKQNLTTNSQASPSLTATNTLAGWEPTLVPYSGGHPIGLSLYIGNTNVLANTSNVVVSAYRAYDINGGSSGIGTAWGTNFETTAFWSWTVAFGTGATTNLVMTNLLTTQWEPATAIGFTLNNQCNSNVTYSLIMSQAP